ncbi:MAG: hypothetical protein WCI34_02485, partial [Actinomycetes bacterium]
AFGASDGLFARSTTLGVTVPTGRGSGWRFDAPAGTSVVGVDWAGEYRTEGAGWEAKMSASQGSVLGCGPVSGGCARPWVTGAQYLHRAVPSSPWLEMGVRCVVRPGCRGGNGRTLTNAQFSTWFVKVRVSDPSPPVLGVSGLGWGQNWVQPGTKLSLAARDASGISDLRVLRDGQLLEDAPQSCDWTRARPCADQTAEFSLPVAKGVEGLRRVSAIARDAAGNQSILEKTVGVDGTAPELASPPTVEGGDGWRSTSTFRVKWGIPSESGVAPVASSRIAVCLANDPNHECLAALDVPYAGAGQGETVVTLPHRGDWVADVSLTDEAGNSSPLGQSSAHLRFDDEVPSAPSVSAPAGWITRERADLVQLDLRATSGESGPIAGIARWSWWIGNDLGSIQTTEGGLSLNGLPEGVSEISVRAISGSGLASRQSTLVRIRIDETPPSVALSGLSGHWESNAVEIGAMGRDQLGLSGMGGADGSLASTRIWLDGGLAASDSGADTSLTVDTDGVHVVEAESMDAAGNRSARVSGKLMVDRTPPERVVFLPQDAADPRVVRVDSSDVTSGVAAVAVRMRPVGGGEWRPLPMEVAGARATGTIDDSGLPAGLWELEATATDVAGNKTVTDRSATHDLALVALPLRGPSRIEARMGDGALGTATSSASLSLQHGADSALDGRVLDRDDLPVAGAVVTAESQAWMAGASWVPLSAATTDHAGRFHFHLAGGPSRHLRLTYGGSRRDLQSGMTMHVRVPARSTIAVSPRVVRVGRSATFSGVLDGGWLPSGGKLVMIQAAIPHRGWQTFAIGRATSEGKWSVGYRFRAAVGRVNYSIRVVVPTESDYPFSAFSSGPIVVTAVG